MTVLFVRQPNGFLACFSLAEEKFTHTHLTLPEALAVAGRYGDRTRAGTLVEGAMTDNVMDLGCAPRTDGLARFYHCLERVRLVRGAGQARGWAEQLTAEPGG